MSDAPRRVRLLSPAQPQQLGTVFGGAPLEYDGGDGGLGRLVVERLGAQLTVHGAYVLGQDTTLVAKSARRMLGVHKWHDHSGNTDRDASLIGHHWTLVGLSSSWGTRWLCWPLVMRLVPGHKGARQWLVGDAVEPMTFWDAAIAAILEVTLQLGDAAVTMAVSCKGAHFPQEILVPCVRWSVASPLSTRHLEALLRERGVHGDHSTVNRGVIQDSPQLEEVVHRRQRPVWVSGRMDATSLTSKGHWDALSRAVDTTGQTMDCLLMQQQAAQAAKRFLTKAIRRPGRPAKITIDGSAATQAALERDKAAHGTTLTIRQGTSLKNIVDQDPRAVKRVTRPMLGFTSFHAARRTLVGIARMHMMQKQQLEVGVEDEGRTAAVLFSSLAVSAAPQTWIPAPS